MSTVTAQDEAHSHEALDPCKLMVFYEDADAHDLAMELCNRLVNHFSMELPFVLSSWQFRELADPVSVHEAIDAAADADIIVVSTRGVELPAAIRYCLDSCPDNRTKEEGALVALVTDSSSATDASVEALLSRLQQAAYRLRMDFFPPELPSINRAASILSPPGEFAPFRIELREDIGYDHSGLNE